MKRRTFLKGAAASSAALMMGSVGFRIGGFWWDQAPGSAYQILSETEGRIVRALAGAIFPGDHYGPDPLPSGASVGLDHFFDEYVAAVPPSTGKLLRVLLHAIDDVSALSGSGVGRFHARPLDERIAILQAWDSSRIGIRRGMFSSIKMILSMGYCERPEVAAAAGIHLSCGGIG